MVEQSEQQKAQQVTQTVRQLKIKTGVCTRSVKDHQSYKKEKTQLEEKIEKLKTEGTEEGVLKRYEQDLADTIAMLPSLKTKIEDAVSALEEVQGTAEENGIVTDEFKEKTAEWGKAEEAIKTANDYIENEAPAGL